MTARKTTQTTPAGTDIPIPKRGDFFRDLERVSDPERPESARSKPPKGKAKRGDTPTG